MYVYGSKWDTPSCVYNSRCVSARRINEPKDMVSSIFDSLVAKDKAMPFLRFVVKHSFVIKFYQFSFRCTGAMICSSIDDLVAIFWITVLRILLTATMIFRIIPHVLRGFKDYPKSPVCAHFHPSKCPHVFLVTPFIFSHVDLRGRLYEISCMARQEVQMFSIRISLVFSKVRFRNYYGFSDFSGFYVCGVFYFKCNLAAYDCFGDILVCQFSP